MPEIGFNKNGKVSIVSSSRFTTRSWNPLNSVAPERSAWRVNVAWELIRLDAVVRGVT